MTESARKFKILENTSNSVLKLDNLEAIGITPFDEVDPQVYADWYLKSCYPELPFHDEKLILEFLVSEGHKASGAESLLEMGCGPTISHSLPLVPYVDSLFLSDYLETNLSHVLQWIKEDESAHNWSLHTAYVLQKENRKATSRTVKEREDLLRKKLRSVILGDLLSKRPIRRARQFPAVSCFYATEQAAQDETEWLDVMQNLSSLLQPGGVLFLACVHDSEYYAIHDKDLTALRLPIVRVTKKLMEKGLKLAGFSMRSSEIHVQQVGGLAEEGINGIVLVSAIKAE